MNARHCHPDELLDVAEGVRDEVSLPHLTTCQVCRVQLNELRRVLGHVKSVDVPEPSPLFWDRLSARVREAVSEEPRPVRAGWWRVPSWKAAVPALAACALVLLVVLLWPGADRDVRPTAVERAAAPSEGPTETVGWLDPADDASIGLMMELAGSVDLDAVANAGLMTTSGAADAAVSDLSVDERRELERLLKAAINGSGA